METFGPFETGRLLDSGGGATVYEARKEGDRQGRYAVKVFSLTILAGLAADYPDIRSELKLLIEEQWDTSTPAFRSRAKAALKTMERKL